MASSVQADCSSSDVGVLRQMILSSSNIVGFTGAGISTECGVPDFRSPGSPWMVNKPISYSAFRASPAMRIEAWRRKFIMDDHYRNALPGRGHKAIKALIASSRMSVVITQNIDNLHQLSGVTEDKIIELHGNGSYATCLDCAWRYELEPVRERFEATGCAPDCERCGGPIKSATISFGQAMPELKMQRAVEAARCADLFISIGSSLVVYPAAHLPALAKESGAVLVIINAEPTPCDVHADMVIRSDIGSILQAVTAEFI